MGNEEPTIPNGKLKGALECMLFVSPQPLDLEKVAQALNINVAEVSRAMEELRLEYSERGLCIVRIAGGYQMCTRPEYAEYISALLKPQRTRLSQAALETLAVIAYKQPITQPEIEAIRGVNSEGVLKTLLERSLIKPVGRRETAGRPIIYGVTDEFMNHFGLNDLSELPDIETLAAAISKETSETITEQKDKSRNEGNVENN